MKYTINEEYFDRLTESSSYVLGYLFADGSVKTGKGYILTIAGRDKDLLEQILEDMESDHRILPSGDSYKIVILSKSLVQALEKWGLRAYKTKNLKFPSKIPSQYMHHFMRGYFDGKGCWMVEKGRRITAQMTGANPEFMERLRDELVLMGLTRAEVHPYGDNKSSNYIRYYVKDTKRLYYIMYYKAGIYSRPRRAIYEEGI